MLVEKKGTIIDEIRTGRKVAHEIISNIPNARMYMYNTHKAKIIIDGLLYIAFKSSSNPEKIDVLTNQVFNKLTDKKLADDFFLGLSSKTVTIQNVIDTAIEKFCLTKIPDQNLEEILIKEKEKISPDLNFAFHIYLMKGKFSWVNAGRSKFKDFLLKDELKNIPDDARINCWEAILCGLVKSGLLDVETLKKYYDDTIHIVQKKLDRWFGFESATNISIGKEEYKDWKSLLRLSPHFIMMSKDGISGLDHDMVSIPYSQKQILKMLITKEFNEKPLKPKLMSHWMGWTHGILATVKKEHFNEKLKDIHSGFRVRTLEDLINRKEMGM